MQPLPNISFVITKLRVFPKTDRAILKNISLGDEPIEFVFTTETDSSFFGNNITIQTVVGENGSGKSTVLDILFRLVNNFGSLLFCRQHAGMGYRACFVKGVYADLEYGIYGRKGVLRCRDMMMELEYDGKRYALGEGCLDVFPGARDANIPSDRLLKEITRRFFYTIATNYSMHAFVSDDYAQDKCMVYSRKTKRWINGRGRIWIDTLFHKNDGYMSPINLNPFRDNGMIDMTVESHLTRSRIASLLIYLEKKRVADNGMNAFYSLLDGYRLDRIDYTIDYGKIIGWFGDKYDREPAEAKVSRILESFRAACRLKDSPATYILDSFLLNTDRNAGADDGDGVHIWIAKLYLVCKVLLIAGKYPSYSWFKSLGNVESALITDAKEAVRLKTSIKNLAKKVKNDRSHITIKIRQTLTFLSHARKTVGGFGRIFTYDEYERWTPGAHSRTISDIMKRLPPSFFKTKIYLKRDAGEDNVHESIPFTHLSSGERQFLFTTSTVIYHILNIKSVDDESIHKYRGVNVVFDEVELCFHPEYQRRFIYEFLRLVKAVDIPSDTSLNVIITTHSPFILSDIPKEHILYLKDGKPYDFSDSPTPQRRLNPFAANVSDILRNGFFLKNGFIGEYAQKKIGGLIKFLTDDGERESYDMSLADRLISMVGDPLLKSYLEKLLQSFYDKHPNARYDINHDRGRLKMLETEVEELRRRIADAEDTD